MKTGKIYPRIGDAQTVYLKSVVTLPAIEIGDFGNYQKGSESLTFP